MSTIKITNLTSSGAIVGNVILPVVGNVAGTLTTLKATVDQLKTFITAGAEANITLANTIQSAQITAANVGVIGYINLANTIQSSQITAANLGIYTMGNIAHWTSNVSTVSAALDQLASRIYNIENP
jgi:hypothetical protein